MRKYFTRSFLGILFVFGTMALSAQVTVTNPGNTTPGLAATYGTLAAAITDLNLQTAISGPVTITLDPANPQTSPAGGYSITAILTGASSVNTVTIEGSGNTITAPTTHTVGALNDAIFKFIGADFMILQGFTMLENGANTTTAAGTNNMTEWGVALLYASTTNGAQNITIQNNTITLNRTYQNTFGIYSNSTHSATTVSTSATATTAAGGNSGLKIYGNTISNINNGIVVVGPTAVADMNTGIDIGGSGGGQANTLTNFGTTGTFSTYANVSGTVNGILVRNSLGFNVSYNSLTSSSGATGVTAGTLNGIQIPAASTTGGTTTITSNINNNTLALTSHVLAGAINGINLPSGYGTVNTTMNINANNFTTLNHTIAAATGTITGILQSGSATNGPLTHSISNNTFTNLTSSSTGSFTFISNSWTRPTSGTGNINNNSIVTAFNKTGAGGTLTLYTSNSSSGATVNEINTGNNFSNITVTGATTIAGWASTDGGSPVKTVTGNTFNNWTGGTNAVTVLVVSFSSAADVSGNTITNITGAGNITGLSSSSGTQTISNNTINTLSSTGASAVVTGISISGGTAQIISRHIIHTLSCSGATSPQVNGILVSSGTAVDLFKNKIYGLSVSGAVSTTSPAVNGISLTGGTTVNTYNNLIGSLTAPSASLTDAIRGISVTSTSTSTTQNVSFNTVNLTGGGGANFGSSGIFHTTSTTATTATLNLRNNIIVNNTTPSGTGLAVAFRRSSGAANTLANYGAASNNNLFYAGTPGASNLIYSDGTSTAQTIAAYKAGVFTAGTISPRDNASVSENPPFLSTTGSSANFLHIDPAIATQVESGATAIGGITDDYDGDTRNGSTPDIGADEGTFTLADISGPGINYTNIPNTSCLATPPTLVATITDASGVNTAGGTRPRLYYKRTTSANAFVGNTNADNGWKYVEAAGAGGSPFSFTPDYSIMFGGAPTTGDIIQYFVVAADLAGTPNVGINTGTFVGATPTSVDLQGQGVTSIGGTPNSYTLITPGLSGTVTIGAAGSYTSITGAGGLFDAINTGGMSGNVVANILDASVSETGATSLNAISYNGCASGPYTLTIKPNSTSTLTGSVASGALIKLNGADYVTIDGSNSGGTDRSLTIENTTTTTSGNAVVWLASPAVGNGATNNVIKNCIIQGNSAVTTFTGVHIGGNTTIGITTAGTERNSNNTIQNNLFRKTIYGLTMYGYGTSTPDLNNLVTGNNFGTSVAGEGFSLLGINADRQQNLVVSNNEVQNVTNSTNTSSTPFGGIRLIDFKDGMCYNNRIHDLAYTNSSTSKIYGIAVTNATYTTGGNPSNGLFYNNLVYAITSTGTSAVWNTTGILASAGYGDKFYFNSVHLTGQLAASSSGLVAAFANGDGNITSVGSNIDVRNNIFSLTGSSSVAGGNFAAYYTAATTLSGSVLNYNDLYCNGTNATNNVGRFNSTYYPTLAAWQAATSQDANSIAVDPLYNSPTNLIPQPGSPVVAAGIGGTGVTTDILGITRNASPTLGAYEGAADATAPVITYTPLSITCSTGDRVVTGINITDATGVVTVGALQPRIYYKKGVGGTWFSSQGTLSSGNAQNGNWTFTIFAGDMGGLVVGDAVYYYIIAQDVNGFVSSNPSAGLVATDVNTVTTPPTTPNSYTINNSLNGTYTVGVGGAYTTITAAVAAYNVSCLGGPVTFSLIDATYPSETYPITINPNAFASMTNTLTIKPAVGVSPTISTSLASNYMFRVNGNYVIFDGSNIVSGTTRDMTITNTSTTSPSAILFGSINPTPIVGGTVKNTILINGSNSTSNVVVGGSTSTTGSATTGYANDFTFQNNSSRLTNHGIFITLVAGAGNGTGTLITGNDFATSGANAIKQSGVTLIGVDGATVSNNTIGNFEQSTIEIDKGIWLQTGTINTTVSGNNISTLGFNGTSASGNAYGIWVQTANATSNVNVTGNTITALTSSGAATAVGTTGIYVSLATAGVTIEKNIIQNIKNTNTGGFGANGIQLSSTSTTANISVRNNMISDIAAYGFAGGGATDNGYGIVVSAGAGYGIYYNSVHLNTDQTAVGGLPAAINVTSGVSAAGAIDLRNNIFANSQTIGTERYAIYSGAANTVFSNIDFNDYHTTGPNLGFIGSNRATLADIQTGFGGNTNSKNVLPQFASATDLHLVPSLNPQLDAAATPIGGITTDFDGDTRDVTTPDMGADEFTPVTGVDMGATALVSPAATGCYTATETVTVTVKNFGAAPIDFAINNCTVTVTATGGYNQNVVLTSGILASGATQNVNMPATIDLTVNGAYTFNANTSVAGDVTPGNDAMAPEIINVLTLGGTKTVGTGGDYATITAAVAAYNAASCFTGPVVFSLLDAAYPGETFPITINSNTAAGTNTLTIKPTQANTVITGSSTSAIFVLNGADYIVLDGSIGSTTNSVCPPVSASRDLSIINTNASTTSAVVWLQTAGGVNGATNNVVKNCNITGNSSTTTLVGIGSGSPTISATSLGTDNNVNAFVNNNIRGVQIGIYSQGASALAKNTSNTINQNVMNANRGSSPSMNIGKAGIQVGFENFITISGNIIGSAGGTSTDGFGIAAGGTSISTSTYTGNEVINAIIANNRIDSIRGASTFSASGIFVTTSTNGGTNLIFNNSIANTATNGTSGDFGSGIFVGGGAVSTNVYFNSVSISGTFTGGSQPNFALAIGGTDPVVDIRNNVLSAGAVNGSAVTLGLGEYAIGYAYSTFANLTVNNNDYYTSGAEAKFAKTGSLAGGSGADVANLAALQAATAQDAASISVDPLFNSLSNLQPNIGSPLVGAANAGTGIVTDIVCGPRSGTPTIGAYETAADGLAPLISYTLLTTSCSTGDRLLNGVTITDATGVPTAGALQPRVYFRKNAGTWFSSQGTLQTGSGTNGTWNFTISAATMGGLAAADVIQYYVIAQDLVGTPNIGSNPAAGLVATDVNTVTTHPTSPNSTVVGTTLNGTYTVGTGGAFPTLTAAVSTYNNGCMTGPVIFELLDASYSPLIESAGETFPIVITLNADASPTNTLTIRPTVASTVISGSSTSSIFTLNGARYVTIDGRIGSTGTTNDLTITNTSTTGPAIVFINDALFDTVTHANLKSDITTTTSGVVLFSTTTGTTGNDNNGINNCNIGPNVANPTNGIYSSGTTTTSAHNNSNNTISNNNIFDFYNSTSTSNAGVGVNIAGGNTDWTITGNSFYQTATRTTFGSGATFNGVLIANSTGNNFAITNNFIGGTAPLCGGTPLTLTASTTLIFRAIQATVGTTTPTSIQGNTIRNIALTTTSTSTVQSLISAVTGSFNIGTVSGNTLGSQSATGSVSFTQTTTSTSPVFSGINVGSGTAVAVNIANNTIGGISATNSSSGSVNMRGITIAGASVTTCNVTDNIVGSPSVANSMSTTNTTLTSTNLFYGIEIASTVASAVNITGNTIANLSQNSTGTSTLMRGISGAGTGFPTISNNIIHDLSSASANTTVAGGATAIQGILQTGTAPAGALISLNEVYAISATNTGAVQTNPAGIGYSNPSNGVITRNRIYDIRNASTMAVATTPPTAIGLLIRAALGSGVTISNNMISLGNGQTTNTEFLGIINSFTNAGNFVYHNTVNIEGTAAAGALPSFCFLRGDNTAASAITSPVDIRNNIFNNTRTGGTGIHYAIGNNYGNAASSATGWAAGASNYNALNGSGGVGYWNTSTNFALWKTNSASDALSVSGYAATFVNAATGDLHLNMGITPTPMESGGVAGTGVTIDYDNQTRPGPAGSTNGGATAPDMGADEFDGVPQDLFVPTITYSLALNSNCTTVKSFTASASDNSGINVTPGTRPRVYYKRSTDGNVWNDNTNGTDGWKYAEATNGTSPFNFDIDYALLNGGTGVTIGTNVQYFVVAQDLAGTPNVAINSGTFALAPASVALTSTAFPIGGTINSYNIVAGLSTSLTVGAAGTYPTLTGVGGLFSDINANGLTGNTTVNILDASVTETGAFGLNQIQSGGCGAAPFTLVIKPNAGVTTTLSGALDSRALVRILSNGVTLDGSNNGTTTRDMTLSNTSVTGPTTLLIGSVGTTPVTNTTVKNSILINGINSATALVVSDTTGGAGYFNNITIQNNSVQQSYYGCFINAAPVAGNGSGTLVTGNAMNTAGAGSIRLVGIFAQGTDGITVSNNNIANIVNANAESPRAIWLGNGVSNATVSGNTISDLSLTNTGAFALTGIMLSGNTGSNINITNNTISNLSNSGTTLSFAGILTFTPNTNITNNTVSGLTQVAPGSAYWGIVSSANTNANMSGNVISALTTAGTGTSSGLNIQGLSTGVNIFNNRVSNIKNTNSGGFGANGLLLSTSSSAGNIKVYNNIVYDIAGYGFDLGGVADNGNGIVVTSGAGYDIDFNTVHLNTDQTIAGRPSAFNVTSGVTAAGAINLRNNIFANTQTVGTNRYSIYSGAAASVFGTINNNDYYSTAGTVGFLGSTQATLANWQTATGQDANSKAVDPMFVSAPTNYALLKASPMIKAGVTVSGVTGDITTSTRNAVPSIGAYESRVVFSTKIFLQGAYNAGLLRHRDNTANWTTVTNAGALSHPYSAAPYSYTGTETVPSGFFATTAGTTDPMDWVLVELRDATTPTTVIERRAAIIREDGLIVDTTAGGASELSFNGIAKGNYFVVVRHRNHLGVRSGTTQLVDGSAVAPTVYDFTTAQTQALQDGAITTNAAMALNGSTYLLWAGNVNQDVYVRATTQTIPPPTKPSDVAAILTILGGNPNATGGYTPGDVNLDGYTRATTQTIPPPTKPSDGAFILSTPLGGNSNATRQEHKVNN